MKKQTTKTKKKAQNNAPFLWFVVCLFFVVHHFFHFFDFLSVIADNGEEIDLLDGLIQKIMANPYTTGKQMPSKGRRGKKLLVARANKEYVRLIIVL